MAMVAIGDIILETPDTLIATVGNIPAYCLDLVYRYLLQARDISSVNREVLSRTGPKVFQGPFDDNVDVVGEFQKLDSDT